MTPLRARIVLADDHTIVRRGLALILAAQRDFDVVAQAGDGDEALALVDRHRPDLAILDVSMPRLSGLQAARTMTAEQPEVRILMLSMHDNEEFFFEALRAGAAGYVLKSAADTDLVDACRALLRGEPYVYPGAAAALLRAYVDGDAGDAPAELLTERESEVVTLIAEGHTSREIGHRLSISEKTVERHRANVLEKLGLRDRVALTRYALRRGLVEP